MKNIFDLYTNECNNISTTPGNTVGMGNPMPPTDNHVGSEPFCVKCKKKKSKKRIETEPEIKEGLLDDVEVNMSVGDDIAKFTEWYLTQYESMRNKKLKSDYRDVIINELYKCTHVENKSTIVIDINKNTSSRVDLIELSIGQNSLPSGINTIKIINVLNDDFFIKSSIGDISNIDIEIYTDNGRTFGNCYISFSHFKSKIKEISFGNIVCNRLLIEEKSAEELLLGKNCSIIELNLVYMPNLKTLYANLNNGILSELKCKVELIKNILKQNDVISYSTNIDIRA